MRNLDGFMKIRTRDFCLYAILRSNENVDFPPIKITPPTTSNPLQTRLTTHRFFLHMRDHYSRMSSASPNPGHSPYVRSFGPSTRKKPSETSRAEKDVLQLVHTSHLSKCSFPFHYWNLEEVLPKINFGQCRHMWVFRLNIFLLTRTIFNLV